MLGDVIFAALLHCTFNDVLRDLLRAELLLAVVDRVLVAELVPYTVTRDYQELVKRLECVFYNMRHRNEPRMTQTMIAKGPGDCEHAANSLLYNKTIL